MSNWLDKLKNKSNNWRGREYSESEWNKMMETRFKKRHGDGPAGLDYAESYEYNPNLGEKFLDALPLVGGKRSYNRAMDYINRVHDNPMETQRAAKEFEKMSRMSGKTKMDSLSIDDISVDNRFSTGATVTTNDPTVYSSSMSLESDDIVGHHQFISGNKAGHTVSENSITTRGIDPYNIAVPKQGRTVLGVPIGYSGKITSNVAEGGGSKLNPYLNTETLKKQVMGNKNLAVANKEFYNNKSNWKIKKEASKNVESFNQRSETRY